MSKTTESPKSEVQGPKSAHTPGPWRLNKNDLTVRSINDDIVHVHPFYKHDDQDAANAQLIAAAPDLLDACCEARDWLQHMISDEAEPPLDETCGVRDKCAQAIEKTILPDGTGREIADGGELAEVRPVSSFEVWVRLKKSSKYYGQGLRDQTDGKSKPLFFKLDGFQPQRGMGLMSECHTLRFNSNSYRREDCEFYLVDPKDTKRFVRIA